MEQFLVITIGESVRLESTPKFAILKLLGWVMKKTLISIIIIIVLGYVCFNLFGWQSLLSGVLISVISILFALFYEDRANPNFDISICDPASIENSIYLRLKITNKPLDYLPLLSRKIATSCHVSLSFINLKFGRYMLEDAKWTGNPEPIRLSETRIPILEPSLLRISRFIDIPSEESEELDICFRDCGSREAYIWNAYSYIPTATKLKSRQILNNESYLLLKVKHSTGMEKFYFKIVNPENINQFRIVNITKHEKAMLKKHHEL